MKQPRMVQSGFTLIELLVVIAIIGVLIGLALHNYEGVNRAFPQVYKPTKHPFVKEGQ